MSISAIGSASSDVQSVFQQRRADYAAMKAAVQGGDMTTASSALTRYQQDMQNLQSQFGQTSPFSPPPGASKLQADLASLATAIQGGSAADAQSALKAYQQDRHGGAGAATPAADTSAASTTSASGLAQDIAKLVQDTQAGNASGVQTDTAALAKDLQAAMGGSSVIGGKHGHHHHGGGSAVAAAGGQGGGDGDGDGDGGSPKSSALGGAAANSAAATQYQLSLSLVESINGTSGSATTNSAFI